MFICLLLAVFNTREPQILTGTEYVADIVLETLQKGKVRYSVIFMISATAGTMCLYWRITAILIQNSKLS